ncbi:MAG: hypothetical protein FGM46_06730 [Ferruginibacter sp.]|nr:hypothetical protein [Ferruginibacter sp.]
MKNFILAIFVFFFTMTAKAAPVFFGYSDNIIKIAEFPKSDDFKNIQSVHFDAGYMYKQISIFFVPVWNFDEKWCGYISDKLYIDLSKSDLNQLAQKAGITLPEEYKLSFWERIGGKLVLLSILILYVIYKVFSSKKKQSES